MVDFIDKLGSSVRDFAQSASQKIGSDIKTIAGKGKQLIEDFTTPETVGKQVRTSGSLPVDGKPQEANRATAQFSEPPETKDWRVSLSLPTTPGYSTSPIFEPLRQSGNKLVFPFTPTVIMQSNANYSTMSPVHTNYPIYAYENTEITPIQITGDFFVQTQADARYWVAVLHYFRSVSKMSYGQSSNAGQPPPIVRLNGYGDYIFKNIPVVIQSYMVDLGTDVDYISTGIESGSDDANLTAGVSWAPAQSQFTVNVAPTYSRRDLAGFSLDRFIAGDYVSNGKGFI